MMLFDLVALVVDKCGPKCVYWKLVGGCEKLDNRQGCYVLDDLCKMYPILTLLRRGDE